MQSAHKEKYHRRGYAQGETKRLVVEAHGLGLTIFDVMERSGKSYASIYNTCYRSGIKLKQRRKRTGYGFLKALVFNASEEGTSLLELSIKHGVSIKSLRRSAVQYGVSIKNK